MRARRAARPLLRRVSEGGRSLGLDRLAAVSQLGVDLHGIAGSMREAQGCGSAP